MMFPHLVKQWLLPHASRAIASIHRSQSERLFMATSKLDRPYCECPTSNLSGYARGWIWSGAIQKGMRITLFRSTKEPDVFGFTADPTGGNLPDEFGPWQKAVCEGTPAQRYAGTASIVG
jgi:hypothetical protein